MGEILELMLAGEVCSVCGETIDGEATDYPRHCECCELESREFNGELHL